MAEQPQDIEKLVESLLTPTVDALIKEVRDYMSGQLSDVVKRIDKIEKPVEQQQPEQNQPKNKTESALEQRLRQLEDQLKSEQDARATQEKAASSLRFDQALGQSLDEVSPLHKGLVKELLDNRYKTDAVEKDGQWLTKDGLTLAEATKKFFETTEGSHFIPSNYRDGAGTKEPSTVKSEVKPSTADLLAQAFLNG